MWVTNFDIVEANEFRWAITADAGSVWTTELANSAVTTAKIADSNVTAVKLATDAVETAKIKDNAVTNAKMADDAIKQAELDYQVASVTVTTGQTTGTATVVAWGQILGIYPTWNQDQFVDNVAIASTTLTVTLAAAATADNTFNVVILKA